MDVLDGVEDVFIYAWISCPGFDKDAVRIIEIGILQNNNEIAVRTRLDCELTKRVMLGCQSFSTCAHAYHISVSA